MNKRLLRIVCKRYAVGSRRVRYMCFVRGSPCCGSIFVLVLKANQTGAHPSPTITGYYRGGL